MIKFIKLTHHFEDDDCDHGAEEVNVFYIQVKNISSIVSWKGKEGSGIEMANGNRYRVTESPKEILKMINPDLH